MKIDPDEWAKSLLPYKKFHATYAPKEGWTVRHESVIPVHLNKRLRIVEETAPMEYALDVGRHESLAALGIFDAEVDVVEFAEELFESALGQSLSIRDMEAIIMVFQKYIDEQRAKR